MSSKWTVSLAILSLGVVFGCGSKGSDSTPAAQSVAETEPAKVPIPADSPFAKIKEGMGSDEVYATIGQPTSPPTAYVTGKAFIPFHYGGDNSRMIAHYKGIGSITFSQNHAFTSGMSVMSVDYDPTDPGFSR
jgi:hypothetical protein